jgi:RND family efflux transporter MFP subunit
MQADRLVFLGFAIVVAGCNRPTAPAVGAAPAGPEVSVIHPERKAIRRVVEQPGAAQADEETRLFAKVPGYVGRVAADIGQKVKGPRRGPDGAITEPGDVLAELAVPELEEEAAQKAAAVRQSEAEVEQAKKALGASEAGVASAESMVTESRAGVTRAQALYARWESESARTAKMVKERVIDPQSGEETLNQFRAAQAARDEAEAKVVSAGAAVRKARADRDKAAADVTAAGAKVDVAKADARRVAALLGYTKIRAPFDGVVTRRAVSTGDFLHADGSKEGVFAVARIDPIRIVVSIPEADAGLVREGAPAQIAVPALGGPDVTGKVTRTSWSLEPGSRTLRAEVDLPNADGRVRPGMFVTARIASELPEAWALPAAAVARTGEDYVVYLVENGKAVRTPVQVLRGDGQWTQVRRFKRSGADWADVTGTEAVATPAAALTDGQAIEPPGAK